MSRKILLIERIKPTCRKVFADIASMIEDAIEEARKIPKSNRSRPVRVRGQIDDLDKKLGPLDRLPSDPDIDPRATRAPSRHMGELESRRERHQQDVAVDLSGDVSDNSARPAAAAPWQALTEAHESFQRWPRRRRCRTSSSGMWARWCWGRTPDRAEGGRQAGRKRHGPGGNRAVPGLIAGTGLEPVTSRL